MPRAIKIAQVTEFQQFATNKQINFKWLRDFRKQNGKKAIFIFLLSWLVFLVEIMKKNIYRKEVTIQLERVVRHISGSIYFQYNHYKCRLYRVLLICSIQNNFHMSMDQNVDSYICVMPFVMEFIYALAEWELSWTEA